MDAVRRAAALLLSLALAASPASAAAPVVGEAAAAGLSQVPAAAAAGGALKATTITVPLTLSLPLAPAPVNALPFSAPTIGPRAAALAPAAARPIAAVRPLRVAHPAVAAPALLAAAGPASAAPTPALTAVSGGGDAREFSARPDAPIPLSDTVWTHARSRGFALEAAPPVAGAEPVRGPDLALSAARAAAADGPKAAQAPPAPARPTTRLPGALWSVLGCLMLTSFGVEAFGLAIPQIAREHFGNGMLGIISSVSALALSAGSLLGGVASDRFGPEKTYAGTSAARALIMGGLAAVYSAGALTAPILVGAFAADYVLHYMNYVALDTLVPQRLDGDPVRINRYGVFRQIAVDGVGFFGPIGAGILIAAQGYAPVLWAYPALFLISAASGAFILRTSKARDPRPAASSAPRTGAPPANWREMLNALRRDPALLCAIAGFALLNVASMALYFIIAPAYGAFAAAAVHGSAAQIASLLTGFYAGGGLISAWLLSRMTQGLDREAAAAPEAERSRTATDGLTRRMGTALAVSGAALLAFWSLLSTTPLLTVPLFGVAVPLFAGQLLMIVFGAALTVPFVGLMSVIQARAPDAVKAKTLGANRSIAMFASFLFSNAAGLLLAHLSPGGSVGAQTFTALGIVMTVLAAATVATGMRLRRTAPKKDVR